MCLFKLFKLFCFTCTIHYLFLYYLHHVLTVPDHEPKEIEDMLNKKRAVNNVDMSSLRVP